MEYKLTSNALQVLEQRYLLKNEKGDIIETTEQMFRRVADNIADSHELADKIFKLMCETKFLPNTPALNAGTTIKNFSACFSLTIHDSMEDIFEKLKIAALIFKSGGGVGFNANELRPKGAPVKSTSGIASGVLSFASVYNSAIEQIKAGGKRRGASILLLDISHPEIIDFIHAKDEGSTLSNFNLSVLVTDKFINAVKNNENWNLEFKGKIYKTLPAKELFDMITKHAWQVGDPGLIFESNLNKFNCHKHIGIIKNVNPCGEISIFTGICQIDYPELNIKAGDEISESCNLGSFDISKYVNNGEMNWDALANDIPVAIRFLDCIPDKNEYVIAQIEKGTKLLRKIGLGIMGFADTLAFLNISYNSQDAIVFAEHLMEFVNYHSTKASMELAKEKGAFPAFKGSAWDTGEVWSFKNITDRFNWTQLKEDIKKYGIRNCNVNALAPTGSISIIAGCSSSLEPIIGVIFEKHISIGILYETNHIFKKFMQQRGLWTPEIEKKCSEQASIQHIAEIPDDIKKLFLTSYDVPYQQHIKIQEAFQKFTDINISKSINMRNDVTEEDVRNAYLSASENCKGITIYRDGSKTEQVLVTGKKIPSPRQRFRDHIAIIREVDTGCGTFYNGLTWDEYGMLEIFPISSGKGGCTASQETTGRLGSTLLRMNTPVLAVQKQLHKPNCSSCITKKEFYENGKFTGIKSCSDGISKQMKDYYNSDIEKELIKVQKKIHSKFNCNNGHGRDNLVKDVETALIDESKKKCPECGGTNVDDTKCGTCHDCGFSKCL